MILHVDMDACYAVALERDVPRTMTSDRAKRLTQTPVRSCDL
jgi:hypothetical protein